MSHEFTGPNKDPESKLIYAFDWTDWLQPGETITGQQVFSNMPSIAISGVGQANGIVSFFAEGGDLGQFATITCRITTSAGQSDDRSVRILIKQR